MIPDILGRYRLTDFSAWPFRSSPSSRDPARVAILTAIAASVGTIGWSGVPLLLPISMAFPALWALAPSRIGATLVSAGYFLGASRGLPLGVINYYGGGAGPGVALWIMASLAFVVVHAALWTSPPGWGRAMRYGLAVAVMSVPPLGIAGWANPMTAAGILFPGWGWAGLLATAACLLAVTTRFRAAAVLTIAGFWLWSAAFWTEPHAPEGWVGVDTNFLGAYGDYAGYEQQLATIGLVRAATAEGHAVIVLPEGAVGAWTPTAERLWLRALEGLNVTVNAGGIVVDPHGYDNVMVEIAKADARILYVERMPVPVSMWQPWLALTGESGGARAYFFDNPVVESAGLRIAPLICYEQLLIWPVLQSALHSPDIMVATGNGWWTTGTSIVAIQKAASVAWARLFDLPIVMAFNT